MEASDDPVLGGGFPKPSREDWLAAVDKALKGASFSKLVSKTEDGIEVQPLYTLEDARDHGLPGAAPFARGPYPAQDDAADEPNATPGWDVRALHDHPDPAAANRQILEDLERGVTSAEVRLDRRVAMGEDTPDGVLAFDKNDFARLLGGVYLDLAPVVVDAGQRFLATGRELLAFALDSGTEAEELRFSFAADPLACVAQGLMPAEGALDAAVALAREVAPALPEARALRLDGEAFHAAGATEAMELAVAVAGCTEYLRALVEAGFDAAEAADLIEARVSVDADLFLSIAKLRAARLMWSKVLDASGIEQRPLKLSAVTASRMYARRDPWVNMLRATSAAMAGGLGGAEAVTVLPFDHAVGQADALARRVARNTQLILIEESYLGRVVDPAGGSWLVENLTAGMARAAWGWVQKIEAEGGAMAALKAGLIQDAIGEALVTRLERIAHRKRPITGVSEFPHLREKPRATPSLDVGALVDEAHAKLGEPAPFEPIASALEPMRLAEGFERLRDLSDAALEEQGERPKIFLACVGPLAQHSTRATFAANAFEAGGIEAAQSKPLHDADGAAEAFLAGGAKIACLCGADDGYREHAAPFAKALKAAGCEALYLAGKPDDDLKAAGVDGFVFVGCNLLETLEDAHSLLRTLPQSEPATQGEPA